MTPPPPPLQQVVPEDYDGPRWEEGELTAELVEAMVRPRFDRGLTTNRFDH